MKQSLKFNIEIDENHLPLSIGMQSKDINETIKSQNEFNKTTQIIDNV